MFRFGVESLLYAYLLLPALVALEWWAAARRRRALDRFGERGRIDRLTAAVSRGGRMARTALMLAAVVLLVTALACWWPARLGAAVEPARALRWE